MPTFRLEASQRGKMPAAASTSSLSSSLDSAGSSILPAAPPSNSSQSDIVTYDHKVRQSPSPAAGPICIPSPTVILGAPRSSSLANHSMGHVVSRPAPATPPPSQSQAPTSPSKATSRLKRVFGGGRRKKSDDVAQEGQLDLPPVPPLKVKGKQREPSPLGERPAPLSLVPRSSSSTSSALGSTSSSGSSHEHGRPTRQSPPFWTAAKGKVPSPEPSPPLPPPKSIPSSLLPHPHAAARATLEAGFLASRSDQRGSFLVSSPITAALEYIKGNEQTEEPATAGSRPKRDPELEKVKEDWRKSDSTTTSYYTVRPRSGTSGGTRTPRPVSMAESTNTVVPAATRRMSALITDAEFVMPEEDTPDTARPTLSKRASLSRQVSPAGSSKARKRQSISLHITSPFVPSSRGHISPPTASEMSTLTRAAASGIMANASAGGQIKGRLEAWASAPPSIQEPPSSPSNRSISSGSSRPPAGVMGFGRRAMERMGRAIGHLGAGAHHHQHHGASSNPGSSSSSLASEDALGRTHSNLSTPGQAGLAALGKGKHPPAHWRTPNAPSGTWSISTTGTGSSVDTDAVMSMGRRVRAPVAGGLVFGKALSRCVRVTAVEPVRLALAGQGSLEALEKAGGDVLERRLLPALVVRCVQHLHKWGIEEEGLFRISGRASHIAKLRSEFDTGADYDLRDCAPGDLDPHAVSGIFKAYLRELPEPILTHALNPYFEAAMHAETNSRKQESPTHTRLAAGGAPLPSNPRNGNSQSPSLRKPPSLSTLAMPSFAGMRPPSDGLLAAFSALIARLPRENRDLLRTLTELINATASRKETRMPLSNLTVIFCPSLNMSPPILRVLCEAKNIWDGPLKDAVEEQVIDIKRAEPEQQRGEDVVAVQAEHLAEEESVVDIRMEDPQDGNMQATAADDHEADGDVPQQYTTGDDQSVAPAQTVLTTRSDLVHATTEDIADSPSVPEIDEVADSPPALEQSQSRSSIDNESFVSAGQTRPATPQLSNPQSPQSVQILSSSAESLATPSNFSDDSAVRSQDQPAKKLTTSPPHSPAIADVESETPLPIAPSHSRPLPIIIAPLASDMASVAFPTSERIPSTPSTPYTPAAQASTNSPKPESPSATTPPPEKSSLRDSPRTRSLRMKRPSLSMLFKKRSVSSIGSSRNGLPSPYTPLPPLPTESPCASSTSSGSPSTPRSFSSMVTAPLANSRFSLPPMLDTQIDSSSLDLALGVESVEEGEDENAHSGDDTTVEGTVDAHPAKARAVTSAQATSPISPAATINTTSPISPSSSTPTAERFRVSATSTSSTTSSVYVSASSSIQGTTLRPQASQASLTSSAYNRLSVWDDDEDLPPEDNWADAVLMEAEKGWAARRKSKVPQA